MASFNDTLDLERAYLKAITSSVIMARTYLHQGREEYFTSTPRQLIFALASLALSESNTLLTRAVYEYEVGSRLSDQDFPSYVGEWNMIDGVTSFDAPEAILGKLKDAETGRNALRLSESVVEMLSKGQIQDAVSFLKREAMLIGGQKEDRPLAELTDFAPRLAMIRDKQQNPMKYMGLKTGFKTFDEQTGGLFPGELTLIAGITGLGKSTMCRSLARGITTLNGAKNVLHVANEEYLEQVQHKYDAVFTGIPYQDFKFAKISDAEIERWQKYMQEDMKAAGRGQIFIKEVAAFTDVSLIEQQYRLLENKGIPIHAIIIDHLPHVKPIQQAWGENDERAKAATDCKELARWLRVPVITPTQAATDVEKKTNQGKRAGKMDVYGSKGQIHVANTFLIITYAGTDDTQVLVPDYLRDVYWLCDAKKNRDGAPFNFNAKHEVKIGRVTENDDQRKKPGTAEAKAVNDAVKDAVKDLGTTVKPTAVPVVPVLPVASTGLRDRSMEFAEAIDGAIEGEDDEAPGISSQEDQEIEKAMKDAEESFKNAPVPPQTAEELEAKRIEQVVEQRPKTTLERLNLKKFNPTGV